MSCFFSSAGSKMLERGLGMSALKLLLRIGTFFGACSGSSDLQRAYVFTLGHLWLCRALPGA